MLLFGGADASQVLGDVWSWDSAARLWRLAGDAGPDPRTFPAMAYHARCHEVVLFGGNRVLFGKDGEIDTFLEDTWTFQGARWTRRSAPGPEPRAEAAMAYDRDRGRIVLFGGYRRSQAGDVRLGDTWEWDGASWARVATEGPSPRNGAALAYDERRRRTVLFGGRGASNETWEWDGAVWKQLPASDAPGRFNPAMAYDVSLGSVVRFGGWTGDARSDDTWKLDASRWSLLKRPGPEARNHSSMAYDRVRHVAVLFGGHDGDDVFGDTWEWGADTWRRVGVATPQKRVVNGH